MWPVIDGCSKSSSSYALGTQPVYCHKIAGTHAITIKYCVFQVFCPFSPSLKGWIKFELGLGTKLS